jgi:hypothetical protein
MAIDDDGLDAASAELVGEHQSGWTGSHDEDVDVGNHCQLLRAAASGQFQGRVAPAWNDINCAGLCHRPAGGRMA